jgi:hypothetical protein
MRLIHGSVKNSSGDLPKFATGGLDALVAAEPR